MRLEFVLSAINININKSIFFSITVHLKIIILWTRRNYTYVKMILTAKHVTISWNISPLYTFKPFISHNRIYRNRKKYFIGCLGCRIMTLIDKTPFICRFFRHFIQFSISLLYKDVTRSDRIQRCDVTISLEAIGCFRNVFGKF